MTDTTTPYLSTRQAALYLGLAPRTLANKRSRGEGPRFLKSGQRGVIRYLKSELDLWIRSGRL